MHRAGNDCPPVHAAVRHTTNIKEVHTLQRGLKCSSIDGTQCVNSRVDKRLGLSNTGEGMIVRTAQTPHPHVNPHFVESTTWTQRDVTYLVSRASAQLHGPRGVRCEGEPVRGGTRMEFS